MNACTVDASVLIVSFNTRALLCECLDALAGTRRDAIAEVLVLDNASGDGSADAVAARHPWVRLVRSDTNLGFAAANNRLLSLARGRYVVLLNPDARLDDGVLQRAIARMDASPRIAAAGARLVAPDGSAQPSARRFPSALDDLLVLSGLAARYPRSRFFGRFDRTWADPLEAAPVDWVPGAFVILRREVLEDLGFFDERFFLYYEEVDLCRRIRAGGHEVWYWPDLVVTHVGGASSRTQEHLALSAKGAQLTLWRLRSALLYHRKHHGLRGALPSALIEGLWHAMRATRNGASRLVERRARAGESRHLVALVRRAWRDTLGGRVSPARPW